MPHHKKPKKFKITPEELEQLYLAGLSVKDMEHRAGIGRTQIWNILKSRGIHPRQRIFETDALPKFYKCKYSGVRNSGRYRYVYHPTRGLIPEHRLIMELLLREIEPDSPFLDNGKLSYNLVVHHIDRDTKNNTPANLKILTAGEHIKLHRAAQECHKYSDKYLLEHLSKHLRISGDTLRCSSPEFAAVSPGSHIWYRRFGSWAAAIRLAKNLDALAFNTHGQLVVK